MRLRGVNTLMATKRSTALLVDVEHMMNESDGYAPLVKDDNHDLPIPNEIMDAGHHFDNFPQASRQGC